MVWAWTGRVPYPGQRLYCWKGCSTLPAPFLPWLSGHKSFIDFSWFALPLACLWGSPERFRNNHRASLGGGFKDPTWAGRFPGRVL